MSQKLPALNPKKVITILLRAGFYIYHQKGGHVQLRHNIKIHLRVTVSYHTRFDLPPSVINSILQQAEISKEEFLNLLRK